MKLAAPHHRADRAYIADVAERVLSEEDKISSSASRDYTDRIRLSEPSADIQCCGTETLKWRKMRIRDQCLELVREREGGKHEGPANVGSREQQHAGVRHRTDVTQETAIERGPIVMAGLDRFCREL